MKENKREVKETEDKKVAFTFLKIVLDRKVRSWMEVPEMRSAEEETIRIGLTVT